MNKHYLFLPVIFILLLITVLLGFKSQAQELKMKSIQAIKVIDDLEDAYISTVDSVIMESNFSDESVKVNKMVKNKAKSDKTAMVELINQFGLSDTTFSDFKNLIDPLNKEDLVKGKEIITNSLLINHAINNDMVVGKSAEKDGDKSMIFIGERGDELLIERDGEIIFLNKNKNIEQLDSEMHMEFTEDGKRAIVVHTKIILDASNDLNINELNAHGIMSTENAPEFEYLRFYPNPTKSHLNISFKLNKIASTDVLITNVLGQTMFEDHLDHFIGTYNQLIDVSSFEKGTYILSIQNINRNISKKIIVE